MNMSKTSRTDNDAPYSSHHATERRDLRLSLLLLLRLMAVKLDVERVEFNFGIAFGSGTDHL